MADRQSRLDVLELICRDKPYFVMLCPPCTKFCAFQRFRLYAMFPEEWNNVVRMVDFAVEIAELQMQSGRLFAFEHPLIASSWALPLLV